MVGRIRIRDGPRVENRCSFIEKNISLFLLPSRLVVPNKGYSSLDQSPDEKPLVALDTDRYALHSSFTDLFMPLLATGLKLTVFICLAAMTTLTCLDIPHQDTHQPRWGL